VYSVLQHVTEPGDLGMKRLFLASAIMLGFASPAFANHCPKDIKLIDAALAQQSNAEAKALRDKGEALHKAGKHAESLEALHQAMQILGLEH
jgi:dihydrodipicolinate synthase/N-acetylneuraminate lyase